MGLLGAREGCSAACSLPAQRAGGHTRASGARASAAPSCVARSTSDEADHSTGGLDQVDVLSFGAETV